MNKRLLTLLLVLVLAIVYLMLPKGVYINNRVSIKINPSAAYRCLARESEWIKWWPGKKVERDTKAPLTFEKYTYNLRQNFFNSLVIQINDKDSNISSSLMFIPLGIDYTIFEWKAAVEGGFLSKIQTYLRAKSIQGNMENILQSLKVYMEKEENIYGFRTSYSKVKDTFLITTRFTTQRYPTTNQIYQYISSLKEYIASNTAKETNFPMLHVNQLDSNRFENKIAIPVNVEIQDGSSFAFKRMVPGNILEAEVRGGPVIAQQAMVQLDNYVKDHQLSSPALPFMLLVTDRSKERDTAKWVTKVYYPVY